MSDAEATVDRISLEGLVSRARTHFFDFMMREKLRQKCITSLIFRSSAKIPRTPEIDIFNVSQAQRLFINSDGIPNNRLDSSARQSERLVSVRSRDRIPLEALNYPSK